MDAYHSWKSYVHNVQKKSSSRIYFSVFQRSRNQHALVLSVGFLHSCNDQEGALCSHCLLPRHFPGKGRYQPPHPQVLWAGPALYLRVLPGSSDPGNVIYLLPGPEHLEEPAV